MAEGCGVARITAPARRPGTHSKIMAYGIGAKSVLVVDHESEVRILLRRVLENAGYAVDAAEDGAQALRKIELQRPDLVILDLRIPAIDGWGVLERLPRMSQPPVVVVLASFPDDWRAMRAGAWDCVAKPFHIDELLATCVRAFAAAGAIGRAASLV